MGPLWTYVLSDCFLFVLNALFNTKSQFYCTVLDSCFMGTSIRDLTGSITLWLNQLWRSCFSIHDVMSWLSETPASLLLKTVRVERLITPTICLHEAARFLKSDVSYSLDFCSVCQKEALYMFHEICLILLCFRWGWRQKHFWKSVGIFQTCAAL